MSSAPSIESSPRGRAEKLLRQAEALEKQLSGLDKSNDDKAARLRSHLCEVLSDLLISDPLLAMETDCAGRLFRSCFYAPIGVFRSRIIREKRKRCGGLHALEDSFKKFLGEAITLYDYLMLQYESKLVPSTAHGYSQSQQSTQEVGAEPTLCEGVVQGLFRLYIHTGDLHRYGENYHKAEHYYLNASKLAPGMGNPYNQLAVVAQLKDPTMTCVALFWYALSLLATHDSFETSTSNLDRLFHTNRTYLTTHCRDVSPPVLFISNKMSPSILRAQKAAASKSCLAHFVDMHFELCSTRNSDSEQREIALRDKMTAVVNSFHSLLQASALSDSLLFKMVVINCFAVHVNIDRQPKCEVTRKLSVELFYVFGCTLSKQLLELLHRGLRKTSQWLSSAKLLLPYCIICEFVEQLAPCCLPVETIEFWDRFVDVANLASELFSRSENSTTSAPKTHTSIAHCKQKEYQMLRGFRPFSFLDHEYTSGGPFIGPAEAVDLLSLTQSHTDGVDVGKEALSFKAFRFLRLCERFAENKLLPVVVRDNTYVLRSITQRAFSKSATNDSHTLSLLSEEAMEENSCDTTLNQNPNKEAQRPAKRTNPDTQLVHHDAQATTNGADQGYLVIPQARVRPPPGFGDTPGETRMIVDTRIQAEASKHNQSRNRSSHPTSTAGMPRHESSLESTNPPGNLQQTRWLGEEAYVGVTANPYLGGIHNSLHMPETPVGTEFLHDKNESLLGSDWFATIWTDQAASLTQTQNPFASR